MARRLAALQRIDSDSEYHIMKTLLFLTLKTCILLSTENGLF